MKQTLLSTKAITALLASAVLLYVLVTTPSPKIILVPFLVCSLSIAGREIALAFGKEKVAAAFRVLFTVGFLLLLFGFLFAEIIYAKEGSYTLIVASIPFWLVGVAMLKRLLQRFKPQPQPESELQPEPQPQPESQPELAPDGDAEQASGPSSSKRPTVSFPIIMSSLLVGFTLLAGVVILIMGVRDGRFDLMFAGAFFAFGSFTFVLAALKAKGLFDSLKVDVLGAYMGAVIAAFGLGAVVLKYGETLSIAQTVHEFGPWIAIPALMVAVGVIQFVKCLVRRP